MGRQVHPALSPWFPLLQTPWSPWQLLAVLPLERGGTSQDLVVRAISNLLLYPDHLVCGLEVSIIDDGRFVKPLPAPVGILEEYRADVYFYLLSSVLVC